MTKEELDSRLEEITEQFNETVEDLKKEYRKSIKPEIKKYSYGQYFQYVSEPKRIYILAFVGSDTKCFNLIELFSGCRVFQDAIEYDKCNSEHIKPDRFTPITYKEAMRLSWTNIVYENN